MMSIAPVEEGLCRFPRNHNLMLKGAKFVCSRVGRSPSAVNPREPKTDPQHTMRRKTDSGVNLVQNLGDTRARTEGPNFGTKPRGP